MDRKDAERQRIIGFSVDVYIYLVLLTLFAYLSISLIMPFLSVILWAIILSVAIYPLFLSARDKLGGRSGPAAMLIGLAGLLIVLIPAIMVVDSIIDTIGDLSRDMLSGSFSLPAPDESVKDWPLIGERIHALWQQAHQDIGQTVQQFAPQLEAVGKTLLGTGANLMLGVLQLAFSVVLAAVFLHYAEPLASSVRSFAERVATDRGRALVDMAGATIRSVSRGVLGVAVIQGGLGAIGIMIAGIPFAGVISAILVMACVVQVPVLVIVPVIIFAWYSLSTTAAVIFTIYMIPVLLSDNVLKPVLMARGLETPMVIILLGVIGGTITSGLMGLFIGPVILALFYKMVTLWLSRKADAVSGDGGTSVEAAQTANKD